MTEVSIIDVLKELRKHTAGVHCKALAQKIGVSASYLSNTLSGNRDPGPTILSWMGYERVAYRTYRKIDPQPESK